MKSAGKIDSKHTAAAVANDDYSDEEVDGDWSTVEEDYEEYEKGPPDDYDVRIQRSEKLEIVSEKSPEMAKGPLASPVAPGTPSGRPVMASPAREPPPTASKSKDKGNS
jgi:hypothetical protein